MSVRSTRFARARATLRNSRQPADSAVRLLVSLVTRAEEESKLRAASSLDLDSNKWTIFTRYAGEAAKTSKPLRQRVQQLLFASSVPAARQQMKKTSPSLYDKNFIVAARTFFPFVLRTQDPKRPIAVGADLVTLSSQVAAVMPKSPAELAADLAAHRAALQALKNQLAQARLAGDPRVMEIEVQYRDLLKSGAALVTAVKLKRAGNAGLLRRCRKVRLNQNEQRARLATVTAALKGSMDESKRIDTVLAQVSDPKDRIRLVTRKAELTAANGTLMQRLGMIKAGQDFEMKPRVQISQPRIALPVVPVDGTKIDPVLRRVMIRYLATRLPRREGEDRCSFVERLRVYAKRALARYAVGVSQGVPSDDAANTAVVETIVTDAPVLEAEVNAGGEAVDAAADMMESAVDQMDTDLENAATDAAPETALNSGNDVFSAAQVGMDLQSAVTGVTDDTTAIATLDALIAETQALENVEAPLVDVSGEDLVVFEPEAAATAGDEQDQPWYKNKLVIGGGILAVVFALRS